jgi:hypothetical protein
MNIEGEFFFFSYSFSLVCSNIFILFSYCIVADFAQNLQIPHFGDEQPGDTYYYSPLFVYVFGVVDVSSTPDVLFAYGYREDDGAKGGNNVASLLLKSLRDFNFIMDNRTGSRLSIIMDNCSGQNKNRHVLRLALWLVEMKVSVLFCLFFLFNFVCLPLCFLLIQFFHKVEFIFYVRGHTKNACDRMFNLLKKEYRKRNVYTVSMLGPLLSTVDNVFFFPVTHDSFRDIDKMLNVFYKVSSIGFFFLFLFLF